MPKKITNEVIQRMILLRQQGYSLPEIRTELSVGYGTIYRYIKDIEILPEYQTLWFGKRGGSKKRKKKAEISAIAKADSVIVDITLKEKLIFLVALYWGEGSKGDFGLCNSDPQLIQTFVVGLEESFGVTRDRLRVSIRIYEDMDREKCLEFWSSVVNIPVKEFVSVTVLKGKKLGKLPYGMCRIRVTKGGDLLKYILALKNNIVKEFIAPVA